MKTIIRVACGCVLFLAPCGFGSGQDTAKPLEATLCDLYQHPEQYTGRMVRVRGGSVGDLRIDNILHDSHAETCPAYMRLVVVFPDQIKPAPAFELVRDESYKGLEEALYSPGPVHIDATYEGRFDAAFLWRDHKRIKVGQEDVKGYGNKHEYDGRIVLHQVSDVWTMRLPRR
jgi:hypothetical protein